MCKQMKKDLAIARNKWKELEFTVRVVLKAEHKNIFKRVKVDEPRKDISWM